MRSKLFWGILIVLAVVVVGVSTSPRQVFDWLGKQPVARNLADRIYNDQYLPGPLRGPVDSIASQLTRDGVILSPMTRALCKVWCL
jgi:hypothetical protein